MKPNLCRTFTALLFGLACHYAAADDAFNLITRAELQREQELAARMPDDLLTPKAMPVPGAPVIELRQPRDEETLKAPFPIQLAFKPAGDAEIAVPTFRVLYGFLKLDITDRVLQHAKLTGDGLSVDKANIPAGSHKLTLQIRDTKDRKTETTISFKVE